jgi:hypothetical protein
MSLDARPQTLNVLPSEQEREEFGLTLKNGVELQFRQKIASLKMFGVIAFFL